MYTWSSNIKIVLGLQLNLGVYSWTLGFSCSFIWKQCLFLDSFHSCPIAWNCFRSILVLLHSAEITSRHQWCSWLIATVTVDEFWVGQHDYEMLAGGWVQEDVFPMFFFFKILCEGCFCLWTVRIFHNFPAISYYHVYDDFIDRLGSLTMEGAVKVPDSWHLNVFFLPMTSTKMFIESRKIKIANWKKELFILKKLDLWALFWNCLEDFQAIPHHSWRVQRPSLFPRIIKVRRSVWRTMTTTALWPWSNGSQVVFL